LRCFLRRCRALRDFGPALLRDKSTVLQPRTFSESAVVGIIDFQPPILDEHYLE
jgi:hypothetical protein